MSRVERSSDLIEQHGEHVLEFGVGGLVALVLGGLMIYYQGLLLYLGVLLVLGGVAAIGYAGREYSELKKVPVGATISCPYCHAKNIFAAVPEDDETCRECHRLMPIVQGTVLKVAQVRCGFCNTLNYYSEKSVGLICESCDREIPIATTGEACAAAHHYSFKQDDKKYDLVLTASGTKNEQLIQALQHLLALNRNQVKEILQQLPCTLMSGVPRLKAEMIQKDLAKVDAKTETIETKPA